MPALIPGADPEVIRQFAEQGIPLVNPQKAIAARIMDNTVLEQFIRAIAPENRLKVYEAIVPHLGFKAKPYWWLMARKTTKIRRIKNARKKS
jgi:hypothetical protein